VLDETEDFSPLSPYARAKATAERLLMCGHPQGITIFRPTSVHGVGRPTTVQLARFARSPLSSVAGPGEWASPQVLVQNVGSAVAFLAACASEPPFVVLQPSENHTARSVLRVLGMGHEPRHIPVSVARGVLAAASLGTFDPRVSASKRRLKMLWFGQQQDAGWLASQGLTPAAGEDGWAALARSLVTRALA
jgi:UDP-glucose 4-epimerase